MVKATIAQVVEFYCDLGFSVRVQRDGWIFYRVPNGSRWQSARHIDQIFFAKNTNNLIF